VLLAALGIVNKVLRAVEGVEKLGAEFDPGTAI
jgi:hypothetical protein